MVFDAQLAEPLLDGHQEPRDEGPALLGALFELGDDMFVVLGFEVFQCDVLQFALEAVKAQFMSDLGVEVHRLPALLAPFFTREHFERAHHFEPVGQLDEDHARIFRIGNQQVAEIVGLFLGDLQFQFGDVRKAHCEADDLFAEAVADVGGQGEELFGGELLVGQAHHVVQDGRDRGVAAEAHFRDYDHSHGYGMVEQRRAVIAAQARELPVGVDERLVDEGPGLLREVRAHERAEIFVP